MRMNQGSMVFSWLRAAAFGLFFCMVSIIADDVDVVKQRMYDSALSSSSSKNYKDLLELLKPDGSFSDLRYGKDGSNSFRTHGRRQSHLLYHHLKGNANLLAEIESCFKYITYDAPPNTDSNWWGHLIGTPLSMWKSVVLGNKVLDQKLIFDFLDRWWVETDKGPVWPEDKSERGNFAGGNFGPRALLGEVEGLVRGTYERVHSEVGVQLRKELADRNPYNGNGVRADGCLHQHNTEGNRATEGNHYLSHYLWDPYSAEYGKELTRHVSKIMTWFNGTNLEYEEESVEGLYSSYFQCLQWIFRGMIVEPTMAGRKIPLGKTITYFGPKGLIYETGRNLRDIGRHRKEVKAVLHRYKNVVPDPQYALVGHRHFFNSDLTVQQRREYYASVRILSNRTVRPESWRSGENMQGYFQADGFMTVLIDGKEFGTQGNEVFQVYDWARVPSVTNQYTSDIPGYHLSSFNSRRFFNDAKFSGGVTDGFIGLASMVYNRPYVPLHAFKSWFFFNDVIVVVGSGITLEESHKNQHDIATTLTQTVFKGNYIVCTNTGEELTLGLASKDYEKPSWIYHRNVSYVFLNGDEHLHSVAETRTNGDKKLDVFMAWTTHSTYPVNATLAYAVLPSVTLKATRLFFSKPTVEVIANETNKHVVCHHPSIAVGASLPEGGRVTVASCGGRGPWEIEVDIPCLVLVTLEESSRVEEDKIALSVSDPQQMYDVINVSISFEGRHAETMIQLPKDPLRGSSNTTVIKL